MVNVLESNLGGEMMGRAVEPGFGGGKAGAGLTKVASGFGDEGCSGEVPDFITGGGGAILCGPSCCTVGCTKATFGPL